MDIIKKEKGKLQKETRRRYQNLSEEKKNQKHRHAYERYQYLNEEKQQYRVNEYRRNSYVKLKK